MSQSSPEHDRTDSQRGSLMKAALWSLATGLALGALNPFWYEAFTLMLVPVIAFLNGVIAGMSCRPDFRDRTWGALIFATVVMVPPAIAGILFLGVPEFLALFWGAICLQAFVTQLIRDFSGLGLIRVYPWIQDRIRQSRS